MASAADMVPLGDLSLVLPSAVTPLRSSRNTVTTRRISSSAGFSAGSCKARPRSATRRDTISTSSSSVSGVGSTTVLKRRLSPVGGERGHGDLDQPRVSDVLGLDLDAARQLAAEDVRPHRPGREAPAGWALAVVGLRQRLELGGELLLGVLADHRSLRRGRGRRGGLLAHVAISS